MHIFSFSRYEKVEFQARVRKNYDELMDERWTTVKTDSKSLDQVYDEVADLIKKTIETHDNRPVSPLWPIE